MLVYIFDKNRKLTNIESSNDYTPCTLMYIPNAVRLLLKECKGERMIKIGFDINKKEEKAFFIYK